MKARLSAKSLLDLITKITFHSYANKTNFHIKSFALSLAFIIRFKATRKCPVWTTSCSCSYICFRYIYNSKRNLANFGSYTMLLCLFACVIFLCRTKKDLISLFFLFKFSGRPHLGFHEVIRLLTQKNFCLITSLPRRRS